MYEEDVRNLASLLKSKRKEAIKHLSVEMKKNPRGVLEELFRSPERAWKNSFELFRADKKLAFRVVLEFYPAERERAEEVIKYLGYSSRIPKIREFYKLKREIDSCVAAGIGVHYQDAYSHFLSGRMDSAVKKMKRLAIRGKKLRELRRKWAELRPELRKRGKDIPDIEPYLIEADVEGAKELIKEIMDMLYEEDSVPKDGKEGEDKGGKADV